MAENTADTVRTENGDNVDLQISGNTAAFNTALNSSICMLRRIFLEAENQSLLGKNTELFSRNSELSSQISRLRARQTELLQEINDYEDSEVDKMEETSFLNMRLSMNDSTRAIWNAALTGKTPDWFTEPVPKRFNHMANGSEILQGMESWEQAFPVSRTDSMTAVLEQVTKTTKKFQELERFLKDAAPEQARLLSHREVTEAKFLSCEKDIPQILHFVEDELKNDLDIMKEDRDEVDKQSQQSKSVCGLAQDLVNQFLDYKEYVLGDVV